MNCGRPVHDTEGVACEGKARQEIVMTPGSDAVAPATRWCGWHYSSPTVSHLLSVRLVQAHHE